MNTKSNRVKTISYDDWLKMRFDKDPQEALDYLSGMLGAPEEPELFLIALQRVAKAFGMEELANQKGFGKDCLHKTLACEGNPSLKNLLMLLDAMGLQLSVIKKEEPLPMEEETETEEI